MFCIKCGTNLPENTAFCHACGATIGKEDQSIPTPADRAEELKYLEAKLKLHNMKVPAIIAAIPGVMLGFNMTSSMGMGTDQVGMVAYMVATLLFVVIGAYICACIPYAWSILPFQAWGLYGLGIKLMIAVCLGFIVTPIALVLNLSKCRRYEQAHGLR